MQSLLETNEITLIFLIHENLVRTNFGRNPSEIVTLRWCFEQGSVVFPQKLSHHGLTVMCSRSRFCPDPGLTRVD